VALDKHLGGNDLKPLRDFLVDLAQLAAASAGFLLFRNIVDNFFSGNLWSQRLTTGFLFGMGFDLYLLLRYRVLLLSSFRRLIKKEWLFIIGLFTGVTVLAQEGKFEFFLEDSFFIVEEGDLFQLGINYRYSLLLC
jgi:hypothetical protein